MPKTIKTKQPESADELSSNPVCPVECAHCGAWMKRVSGKSRKTLWTCDCGRQITEDALQSCTAWLLYNLIDDICMVGTGAPLNLLPIATMQAPLAEPDKLLDYFEFDRAKLKKYLLSISASSYKDIQDKNVKAATAREFDAYTDAITQHLPVILGVIVNKIQIGNGLVRLILKNEQVLQITEGNITESTNKTAVIYHRLSTIEDAQLFKEQQDQKNAYAKENNS